MERSCKNASQRHPRSLGPPSLTSPLTRKGSACNDFGQGVPQIALKAQLFKSKAVFRLYFDFVVVTPYQYSVLLMTDTPHKMASNHKLPGRAAYLPSIHVQLMPQDSGFTGLTGITHLRAQRRWDRFTREENLPGLRHRRRCARPCHNKPISVNLREAREAV